ncbi:hypothetical protein T10_10973 [Trichinella papuae]|uniref:Uncharacterized protein n=1 Tax=Trichinella papuae TaxID=268474 RepID=A0A0V1MR12_9BILA|nr:hypothetical protein T10_10973 [Trichinella papuae]
MAALAEASFFPLVSITQSWNRSKVMMLVNYFSRGQLQAKPALSSWPSASEGSVWATRPAYVFICVCSLLAWLTESLEKKIVAPFPRLEQHLLQSQQKSRLLRFNACCFFSKATSSGVFSSSLTTGHQKTTSRASRDWQAIKFNSASSSARTEVLMCSVGKGFFSFDHLDQLPFAGLDRKSYTRKASSAFSIRKQQFVEIGLAWPRVDLTLTLDLLAPVQFLTSSF